MIQKLQEKAHAGYPIRPEEIPPPVSIPTDDGNAAVVAAAAAAPTAGGGGDVDVDKE